MLSEILTDDYKEFIAYTSKGLNETLAERIEICIEEHTKTLKQFGTFVKKEGEQFVWFNYNTEATEHHSSEATQEDLRFKNYLMESIAIWNETIFSKQYHSPLVFFESTLTLLKDVGLNLNIKWEKNRDIIDEKYQLFKKNETFNQKLSNPRLSWICRAAIGPNIN